MINDFNNEYILNTPNIIHTPKHQKMPQKTEAYNINISLVFILLIFTIYKSKKKEMAQAKPKQFLEMRGVMTTIDENPKSRKLKKR